MNRLPRRVWTGIVLDTRARAASRRDAAKATAAPAPKGKREGTAELRQYRTVTRSNDMRAKATVQIYWQSDDDSVAQLTKDYQAGEFTVEDLMAIADHIVVEFTQE